MRSVIMTAYMYLCHNNLNTVAFRYIEQSLYVVMTYIKPYMCEFTLFFWRVWLVPPPEVCSDDATAL